MPSDNRFSNTEVDLGVGEVYGYDRHDATESILRDVYSTQPKCYVCSYNIPQYKVVAKKAKHNTAELQNGLYICGHCISLNPIDKDIYGLKELG